MKLRTLDIQTFTTWASLKDLLADLAELTKIRLNLMVLFTTATGFYLAQNSSTDLSFSALFHVLLGTALVASASSVWNQTIERHVDALMDRTRNRPLPAKRISTTESITIGALLCLSGCIYLYLAVNLLTTILAILTLISYCFIYTPIKRISTFNTIIGAIPGAMPPLMGWAAVTNSLAPEAWILFLILFFWQMPHFYAIAWLYRDDYAKAGFKMLPCMEGRSRETGIHALIHSLFLFGIILLPYIAGLCGHFYLITAILFTGIFTWYAACFAMKPMTKTARPLFFSSIIYLPLILIVLVADKI